MPGKVVYSTTIIKMIKINIKIIREEMPGKVSCSYEAIVASTHHNCLVLAPAKVKMMMMVLMI